MAYYNYTIRRKNINNYLIFYINFFLSILSINYISAQDFSSLISLFGSGIGNSASTTGGTVSTGIAGNPPTSPGNALASLIGAFSPDAKSPLAGNDPISQMFSLGQTIANNLPPETFKLPPMNGNNKITPIPFRSPLNNKRNKKKNENFFGNKEITNGIKTSTENSFNVTEVSKNVGKRKRGSKKHNKKRRTKRPRKTTSNLSTTIKLFSTTEVPITQNQQFDEIQRRNIIRTTPIPNLFFDTSVIEDWAIRKNREFKERRSVQSDSYRPPNIMTSFSHDSAPKNGWGKIMNNFGRNFNSFISEMTQYTKTADLSQLQQPLSLPPIQPPSGNPITETSIVTPQPLPDTNPLSTKNLMLGFLKAMSRDPTAILQPLPEINDGTEQGRNRPLMDKLFESDIVLTNNQARAIVLAEAEKRDPNLRRRVKRKVITGAVYRWKKEIGIPYSFHESDNDHKWRNLIRSALELWESETCLRFKENGIGKDRLLFFRGGGCYSSVGRVGGAQKISIGHGCDDKGIISHEVGHALGFWHEQSRYDRDTYIYLRKKFIIKGTDGNFALRTESEIDSMGLPYDLGSVMHYGPNAFTTDWSEITIATKDKNYQHTIGQRLKPSFIDVKQVNRLYCMNECSLTQNKCKHGGYPDPNNCKICKCPDGLGDKFCQKAEDTSSEGSECGGEILALPNVWNHLTYKGKNRCVWRISANNARIRFILDTAEYTCQTTCKSFVEFKHNSDFQQTGFRACCPDEYKNIQVVSDQAEVIIIHDGRQNLYTDGKFSIRYIQDEGKPLPPPPPAIWVPGKENRNFRGIDSSKTGIIEKFILNAIPQIRDPKRPAESMLSIFTDYVASSLLGATRDK
ncbi:Astacin-like metalloendopeptidase [Strongyloides ratti]|uniref:Metalloendopeptidase n=1 Tax=Strongyloides ratti TaxID=34506 RepID=A0A090L919_STRRB|nr:Astacin-like metalloendopeptidase [Strongyloides ratti]CEF66212.1 Astacin-like metalloendopeptidase [Strongyloides ratti]